MHDHELNPPARLLRLQDVADRVALSPRMVQKIAAVGAFPAPVRVGRAVRWRESDVTAWIVDGRRSTPATGRPRRGAGGVR